MRVDTGHRAAAGIVLRPDGAAAVVVRDDGVVVPVAVGRGALTDLGPLFAAVAAAAPDPVDAVTVDVSGLLLDAVVHGHAELPHTTVVRVLPRPTIDPSLARSPADVVERLVARRHTVAGGHDLLGHELRPLDLDDLRRLCQQLQHDGTRHVAVVAPGSQARPGHERAVADAVLTAVPGCEVALASEFGGHGLTAREATVVLDSALRPLARRVHDRVATAAAHHLPHAVLRVARGDSGHSAAARAVTLPATLLGSTDAVELRGASHLAHRDDVRVVLRRPGGAVAGDVRRGLAVVRTAQLTQVGTEVVVPTAVLVPHPGVVDASDDAIVVARDEPDLLACVGAATSRPTSWLDEVAVIESAAELERVRRETEERAIAFATANGAAPGSAQVVEQSIVAVPYSPAGTVRVRIRVAGTPDLPPLSRPVGAAS